MEIIEDNIPEDCLDFKEVEYIKLFKSIGAKLTNATEGGRGIRGFKQSEESKNKRLKSLESSQLWKERGKRHSNIIKEKHKQGSYSNKPPHSEEAKLKIASSNPRRKIITIKNVNTGTIIVYNSIKEMYEQTGTVHETVTDFLYGKRKSKAFRDFEVISVIENKTKAELSKGKISKKK